MASRTPIPDYSLPLDAIEEALNSALPDERWSGLSSFLVTGGTSNLTFELRGPAGALILRRPPLGTVPSGAHDMTREVRILRALTGSPVPVPEVVLYDSGDLLGAECYVMRKVEGTVVLDDLPDSYDASEATKRSVAMVLADTLADLHQIDVDAVGLSGIGRPEGYLERQVRLWPSVWDRVATEEIAEIDALCRLLSDSVPVSTHFGIVHGDFRLDNCLLSNEAPARITAVLDWELSTYGDPLADLGTLCYYWRHSDEPPTRFAPAISRGTGFPRRADLIGRYVERTGANVEHLAFYRALACLKLSVLAADVLARSRKGAMGDQNFDVLAQEVREGACLGLDVLAGRSE